MIRHVAPGHVVFHRQRVDFTTQQRVRQQGLEFRTKRKAAIGQMRHEQRLHSQPVTGEEQAPSLQIVKRKREHAVQPGQALHAPFLPGSQDHLGIPIGVELCPARSQFAAQFAVVVDLAIEDDHRPAITGMHRLRRSGQVDDRQTPMAQRHARRRPYPAAIRPAMDKGIAHPFDPLGIDRLGRATVEDAGNTAHGLSPMIRQRRDRSSDRAARYRRGSGAGPARPLRQSLRPRGSPSRSRAAASPVAPAASPASGAHCCRSARYRNDRR